MFHGDGDALWHVDFVVGSDEDDRVGFCGGGDDDFSSWFGQCSFYHMNE